MKITKIEKKKQHYLLEIDGKDQLYITQDTIVRFLLSKGMQLNQQLLTEIKEFAQFSFGKNSALHYLSFKQRSETEVSNYLKKHDFQDQIIGRIIADLKDNRWIDDQKYAETLIQQNLTAGDKGPYLLKQKLRQKGVAEAVADQELAKTDFSPVADRVSQKLFKKYQNKLPETGLRNKIIQSLTVKGFSYEEAKKTFAALSIETSDEIQEQLLDKELEKAYRRYSKKYEGYALKQRLIQYLARKGFSFDAIDRALRNYQ